MELSSPAAILTDEEIASARAEAKLAALSTVDVSQANAALGLYGDSGCGKTEQACQAIEYCWETYHKISHFYAVDLGGYGNHLIRLAKLGIAKVYAPRNHVEAFETAELISMGYFPETILNPITGYADPHVRLVPPEIRRWTVICPNGHALPPVLSRKRLDGFQQQCPTCKTVVSLMNWGRVDEEVVISPGFKHVGLRIYDSGTSMQDWVMEDMAGKAANEEFGQGNALKGAGSKVVSGAMTFGSNSIQHFGFAQNRMPSWIANSRRIPRNVVPPIWTFLEQRGKDEGNIVIFGPKIAGNAKTSDVPAWLGNCLHLSKDTDGAGKPVNRIWLTNHSSVNEGNIPHLAKHRGDAGSMPPFLEDPLDGPRLSVCSLKYFFVKLDEALQLSLQQGAETYPDAPALHPFDDDQAEEILSTASVSMQAPASYRSPQVAGPVAGAVSGAPAAGGGPVGVPAPPGGFQGVPQPPGMAAPVAAVPAAPAGPRPPMPPAAPAAPVVAATTPVAPPVASTPKAAAPATTAQPSGGAPVRPPTTAAVAAPSTQPRTARPPVPPPPGQPTS